MFFCYKKGFYLYISDVLNMTIYFGKIVIICKVYNQNVLLKK